MIHFLVPCQCLVCLRLDIGARPQHCVFLISLSSFPESIVLKEVTDQPDFNTIVKLEVVPLISWLIWPDTYWVNVWPEGYVFFELSILHSWWLLKQGFNLLLLTFVFLFNWTFRSDLRSIKLRDWIFLGYLSVQCREFLALVV